MSTKTSKEYKAIKNYIHNELGLTKEDIINAIRSMLRSVYVILTGMIII